MENLEVQTPKKEIVHLGNIKLSDSKKAIKLHIFEGDKFYVIPLQELLNPVGKVFHYIDGLSEVCGEITQLKRKNKPFYQVKIFTNLYYIKSTYIELLKNGSELTLGFFEE